MSWNCESGSCLLVPSGPTGEHLFTVVLGPKKLSGYGAEEQVVVVSFSSVKPGLPYDKACEVALGEHPFILKDSYIYYREPRIYPISVVQDKVNNGEWRTHERCNDILIKKVLSGFRKSERLPRYFDEILNEFDI